MALRFDLVPVSFDLEPVMAAAYVVAEERRRFVLVDDDDIHVTIVVEVAEGAATAGVASFEGRSGLVRRAVRTYRYPGCGRGRVVFCKVTLVSLIHFP